MKAVFVKETKSYRKFEIQEDGHLGTLYLPKDKDVPKKLEIEFVTKK